MSRIINTILLGACAMLACASSAVGQQTISYGRTVTVRASSTTGTGHGKFGQIQRYDITNNVPSFFGTIYSGSNARCANISPDGNRVAFLRSDNKICIINIDGSGSVQVLGDIMSASDGWIDWPMQDWIYISPNFGRNGLHRINVGTGQRQDLGDLQVSKTWTLSVAADGTRACISANHDGWTSHIVTIVNNQVSSVQHVGACGGSISPDGALFTLNHGDHQTISVKRFDNTSLHKQWTTSRNTSAGANWNRHRWSHANDWVTLTQGTPYQMDNYHNQVLYYVPDGGVTNIKVTNNNGSGYNEGDDLWVQQHDTPALGLSPTSQEVDAELGGAAPSVGDVAVSNVGTGTLPSLSVSSSQSWLSASISGGGNSCTVSNTISLAGLAGGVHTATVAVSGDGIDAATYSVQMTVVAPPVLTRIAVSDGYVVPGGTVQCNAVGYDQYDAPLSVQPSFTWSVQSGGGTVNASGVYQAPATEGSAVVRASSGSLHDDGTVTISEVPPVHLKIDCGPTPVSGWESDGAYLTQGNDWVSDWSFENTVELSGVVDPAPHDVYPTAPLSQNTNAYSFADLPDADYLVRLHFVLGSGHTGTFNMDYSIEGAEVLSDFDVKTDAGGYDRAVVKEYEVAVADGNGMQITGVNDGGISVFVSGIEIIARGATPQGPALTVLSPNGGESVSVGDEVQIRWSGDPDRVTAVAIDVSFDDGESWETVSGEQSLPAFNAGATEGTFTWAATAGVSASASSAVVRVRDYMAPQLYDLSDAAFTVSSGTVQAVRPSAMPMSAVAGVGVVLYDLRGRRVALRNRAAVAQLPTRVLIAHPSSQPPSTARHVLMVE